jgi:hypothetical protein
MSRTTPTTRTRPEGTEMLLVPYVTLTLLLLNARERASQRLRRDDGGLTLETAVIASALFLAAVALVAVIVRAITNRANQIQ